MSTPVFSWIAWTLILLAVVQTILVSLQTWEHLRACRRPVRPLGPRNSPKAAIITPVKGNDEHLEHVLEALLRQDYPKFCVRFVGETEDEPAAQLVRRLQARFAHLDVQWVTAGVSRRSGQKVHNLLAALQTVPADVKLYAFADADAVMQSNWLTLLASRLAAKSNIGAATGYRDFLAPHGDWHGHVVFTLNSMAAGMLGPGPWHNCIWGGSWIIRREVFEALGVAKAWEGKLDDDYVATERIVAAGLRVAYEPRIHACSSLALSPQQAADFAVRQMFLTRYYAPRQWLLVVCGWTVSVAALLLLPGLGLIGALQGAAWGYASWAAWAVLWLLASGRAAIRQASAAAARPGRCATRASLLFERWRHVEASLWGWWMMLRAARGDTTCWRGITYRLDRRGRVLQILRPEQQQQQRVPLPASGRAA